jgi:hypothetical protein
MVGALSMHEGDKTCLHDISQKPDELLGTSIKICRENSSLFKIGQKN